MKSQGKMSPPLLCHGKVVQLSDMLPCRAEWFPVTVNSTDAIPPSSVGYNGRVALRVFSLIDSTGRRRSISTLFAKYIRNGQGQWVNETKGLWQFSLPMCSFRLTGQLIKEKNGCRQMNGQSFLHFIVG